MVVISDVHLDVIHDTSFDYYGKRLATCSSDKTVKIFTVEGESYRLAETLTGHQGPVWRVSWAHPKFGTILASSSYDGKVLIWKEINGKWTQLCSYAVHSASVNSIKWAPHEFGAILLAGSSDGNISIVELKEDKLEKPIIINLNTVGVSSVDWAPFISGKHDNESKSVRRFLTGGVDNLVKVWKFDYELETYILEDNLEGHSSLIKDVSWAPTVLLNTYVATVSEDKTCIIWTQENNEGKWKKTLLNDKPFSSELCRVNWSLSGNILALSSSDNQITLWKENLEGKWETASDISKE